MLKATTIDAAPVLGHFQTLIAHGVPQQALEEALNFTKKDLMVRDARIPFLNNLNMLNKGIEILGPTSALMLGREISIKKMGVCGQIFRNCENLEEATRLFMRFQKILYSISSFKLISNPHGVSLTHTIVHPAFRLYSRLLVELNFSAVLRIVEELTEQEVTPKEIRFSYPKPEYAEAYQDIFGTRLMFNQNIDAILFIGKQMQIPIPGSHNYAKDIMKQHARCLLIQLEKGTPFKDDVLKLIMASLPNGPVDIETISTKLNMSRWTLTRKLKKEGYTFQNILKSCRKEMAQQFIKNPKLSITEIAFLLGYTEVSTFQRAFKKWTGVNPLKYRQLNNAKT